MFCKWKSISYKNYETWNDYTRNISESGKYYLHNNGKNCIAENVHQFQCFVEKTYYLTVKKSKLDVINSRNMNDIDQYY